MIKKEKFDGYVNNGNGKPRDTTLFLSCLWYWLMKTQEKPFFKSMALNASENILGC